MSNSESWRQTVARTWDENARSWDERSVNMWENGSRKDIIPFVEKYFAEGSKVIDIGCGSGYGTFKLHKAGFDATGIDLSSNMIELAKGRLPNNEVNYFTCDLDELVVRREKYDAALIVNVFEWMEDSLKALGNLHTILNEKGYVCMTIFGPTAGPRQRSYPRLIGEQTIFNTIMPWEFEQLAVDNRFTIIDEYGIYKKAVTNDMVEKLPKELQQALSFMWVYILQKQ